MERVSMASVLLTIRPQHKYYKSIEIPLGERGGGGKSRNKFR